MEEIKEDKSIVTSYRLKEETKNKLQQQLKDLGLTQEQYFNKVVSIMELENVKKNSFLNKDTTVIQSNLDAILNAFISVADSSNNLINNKDAELKELKDKYKDMLFNKDNSITQLNENLQQVYTDLDILQSENKEHKSELMNAKSDYMKELEQLQSNLNDKTSLIEEYKSKNDMLLTDLTEYKQYKAENEKLKELIADADTKIIKHENTINRFETEIKIKNDTIESLKVKNIQDIEQLKKENELDVKLSIAELKEQHQKIIEDLNNKYNSEIALYQKKYKELLDEIEQERKKKTSTASKKNNPVQEKFI